jgi:hypothetical protein
MNDAGRHCGIESIGKAPEACGERSDMFSECL